VGNMNIAIKKKSPYGVLSLTLGIISIISALFWYISLPTGVLAIITGIKGKNMVDSKLGTAGKVTGIVGLSIMGFILMCKIFLILVYYIDYVLY